jgi:hypothetical protein
MHFKTPKVDFPIAPVDNFLTGKNNVERVNASEIEITKQSLPEKAKIIVLEPSR